MIPLGTLLVVWVAATGASGAGAYVAFRAGNKTMGWALVGFAAGALSVVSFYTMLLLPVHMGYTVKVAWSRWTIGINGLMILAGGISAFIVNKDKRK